MNQKPRIGDNPTRRELIWLDMLKAALPAVIHCDCTPAEICVRAASIADAALSVCDQEDFTTDEDGDPVLPEDSGADLVDASEVIESIQRLSRRGHRQFVPSMTLHQILTVTPSQP